MFRSPRLPATSISIRMCCANGVRISRLTHSMPSGHGHMKPQQLGIDRLAQGIGEAEDGRVARQSRSKEVFFGIAVRCFNLVVLEFVSLGTGIGPIRIAQAAAKKYASDGIQCERLHSWRHRHRDGEETPAALRSHVLRGGLVGDVRRQIVTLSPTIALPAEKRFSTSWARVGWNSPG